MTFQDESAQSSGGSYIYFWREPDWNAWKIGKGDPDSRMSDYADKNNLRYDAESLRCFAVSSGLLAYRIEQLLHVALVAHHGFRRFPGKGQGLELFLAPQGVDVPEILTELITRTIASVDCGNASVALPPTLSFLDTDLFLAPRAPPSSFFEFLLSEGFTRQQVLQRAIPIAVLDALEERYKRRYEPQFAVPRDNEIEGEDKCEAEFASLELAAEPQGFALQALDADGSSGLQAGQGAERRSAPFEENSGSHFKRAVWFCAAIIACILYYRAFLAPAPTSQAPSAAKASETISSPPVQIPSRPVASKAPLATSPANLAGPVASQPAAIARSPKLSFTCYSYLANEVARADVSEKDGKLNAVHFASNGQRYDRSVQYRISGTPTRWEGTSVRNPNVRMVGEIYQHGSQTRYRETIYKTGSEAISPTDMRCE